MSKDPAFLFYSSDFLTGVSDLTMEERGQFVTLLCLQHQKGHLSEKLMRLQCGGTPNADVLAKFRKDKKGLYFNKRIEEEREKRAAHSEKQRLNAYKRWNKENTTLKQLESNGNATAMPLENENENRNENINRNKNENSLEAKIIENYPFEDFYDLYSKKRYRAKAEGEWKKLSDNRRRLAMDHTQKFVVSEEKQFRPDPHRYLRDRGWENEIIIKQNGQKRDYSELKKKLAQTTE